ncbi:MAG TPA: ABC transporter permease [Candidatus Acidoferrum sp.]
MMFGRKRNGIDFSAEIQAHLENETARLREQGMSEEEARAAARRAFGNVTRTQEKFYEASRWMWWDHLKQDVRFGVRMLGRSPGFTAVVVLTLALGIGANTAIFSVVYAELMKPLPYAGSGRILNVFQQHPPDDGGFAWSYPNFEELRDQNHVFTAVAGAARHQLTLTGRGEPSVVNVADVTGDFFALFDASPLAGRFFYQEDARAGAAPTVVISENLWRSELGADPRIVGTTIDLDKRAFMVIGIAPAGFCFPLFPSVTVPPQVWIPIVQDPVFGPRTERRTGHLVQVTGRVKPSVAMAQVQADMDDLSDRLAKEFPAVNQGWQIRLAPLREMIVENVKSPLLVLLGAVGLVLLIACANIANLLLARATSRAREIAVRTTLGAGRARIVCQLLTETAVLTLLGGVAGVLLARWGAAGLSALLPTDIPRVNEIGIDYSVLGFALLLSVLVSGAAGLVPAFYMAKANLQESLREGGGRNGASGKGRRARNFFAAGEIALAVVLLVGAGLLLRSFAKLLSVNPGFEVEHIVKAEISLPQAQYSKPQQWAAFADDLLKRVQSEPGMQETAMALPMPLADQQVNLSFDILGRPAASASEARQANYVSVSPEYFRVMGVPLLEGRIFDAHDVMEASRVTIISKGLARTYFPNEDPLGKQLSFAFPQGVVGGVAREIVGVVGDVRGVALGADPGPILYVPYAQEPLWGAGLLVKSTLSASGVGATIRQDVEKIDRDLPISQFGKMTDAVEASVAEPKVRAFLLALFAAMALILAATGIFGVISYSVACRTNEIGIRMALGASRSVILRMISWETATLTLAGLAVGLVGALAATRLLGHMLFGVKAYDPATLTAVALILGAVAAIAGLVPMRRAMGVDPLVALRHE